MLSRFMIDPLADMRAMDDFFNRMLGERFGSSMGQPLRAATLPVDIMEMDNNLVIRAAIPGVRPEDLDVSVENNILTIRGETRSEFEDKDAKIYRREVSYGSFARSIRLPENLQLDKIDAEFRDGTVNITIPRQPQVEPKALKVNVRSGEGPQRGLTQGEQAQEPAAAANHSKRERTGATQR